MLERMTIKTEDKSTLEPLLKSALSNEKKMILLGLERTRKRLVELEQKHGMSSQEFEHRLDKSDISETVEFSDWRMEIGMLRLLDRQYQALENAQLD